ncbi:MAG: M50 family metallopeptidase [Acidimicrobiales bacterium]
MDHTTAETGQRPPGETARRARLVVLIGLVVLLGVTGGWSVLAIVGALVVMIFLHELGHYVTARLAGMKVTEFFLGFGPRIWSFRRGETEFGLKVIPAGAYVRIIGMNSMDPVDPADEPRTYRQQSYPRRLGVALAGSAMHFALAMVLIFTLLVGFGASGGALFRSAETDPSDWVVGMVAADSPAAAVGLRPGDRILAVDGTPINAFGDIRAAVGSKAGAPVEVQVERDGATFTVTPTIEERRLSDGTSVGLLGISGMAPIERLNPLEAVPRTVQEFAALSSESLKAMGRAFNPAGLGRLFSTALTTRSAPDTGDSAGPVVDEDRPLSLLGATRLGAQVLDEDLASGILFFVAINVFVGLVNLAPLPPLDGGHVAVATYERIRELLRRDGKRYVVDFARLAPVTYAVVVILAGIGLSTLWLDLVAPVRL